MKTTTNTNQLGRKPYITLKEIQELSKGNKYPYTQIAEKLNNLSNTQEDLSTIDRIIAEGEIISMKMVGIKKLYNMVKTTYVKQTMKEIYNL